MTTPEAIDPDALAAVSDGSMTVRQAMEFTGNGRNKIFDLMSAGTVEWYYDGRDRRITRKSLNEYMARLYAAHKSGRR